MLIKVNGIQVNYELSGKKGAPVVMLSHSLGSSLVMWHPQIDVLEPHFRILRYDIRGHGKTVAPVGPYTLELLGEDAIGLLDALGMNRVHFVGLSMGGMIGQCLALNYAKRLLGLVLCDTASITPREAQPAIQERIDTARGKGMEALVGPTLENWFTPPFFSKNPLSLGLIRKQFLATPVEGYIGCTEAIRRLDYLSRLSGIDLPTLIIVGKEDPRTPVSAASAIYERIANSKLVILPSASHLSNVEQPESFNKVLTGFLKGL